MEIGNDKCNRIKRNNKKKNVFIAFVVVIIIGILIYFRPAPEWLREMVLENKEDYTRIAEIYYNDYLDNHERIESDIMIYSTANSTIASLSERCDPETGLIEIDSIRIIELSEEETASANIVDDTYQMHENKRWNHVIVYGNFVSFGTDNGAESLVYSVNGMWPSYINSPDSNDPKFIKVQRISNHWYYCSLWLY